MCRGTFTSLNMTEWHFVGMASPSLTQVHPGKRRVCVMMLAMMVIRSSCTSVAHQLHIVLVSPCFSCQFDNYNDGPSVLALDHRMGYKIILVAWWPICNLHLVGIAHHYISVGDLGMSKASLCDHLQQSNQCLAEEATLATSPERPVLWPDDGLIPEGYGER